jgi:16S rRNA (cytosine967-C5)-methyltransferase
MAAQKPRQIAVHVLRRHAEKLRFLEIIVDHELTAAKLPAVDRSLVQELTYGVVRWQATLDWLIRRKATQTPPKGILQIILRLGLYQIFWLDRVPDHAAVHETVALARDFGLAAQAGFVNALLRGYLRERAETRALLGELKNTQPSLGFSHPAWLCERWEKQWGEDILRQLLGWNNTPSLTYARLNTLKTTPEELAARWEKEQVTFVSRTFDWTGPGLVYEIQPATPLASLPSFQGLYYVQDPSTLLAVQALEPKPGDSVLDLCAAPGGKTTYIAQCMQNRGYIMAQDRDIHRRNAIKQNCDRQGIHIVTISRATGTINPDLSEPFHKVLVDVPCTNTGVMRRRVDLRWRITPEDVKRLSCVQLDLLRRSSRQVKTGGLLVYSTCSLEPEEDEQVVQQFISEDTAFQLEKERHLRPWVDGVDGAYVACLRRKTVLTGVTQIRDNIRV